MPSAWLYKKPSDVAKLGEKKAPWYVCWYQEGRQKKRKIGSKTLALDFKSKIEGDLIRGEIQPERVSWDTGRERYMADLRLRVRAGTFTQAGIALDHFARVMGKMPLHEIRTRHIDQYASKRLAEKTSRGEAVRPPTINKELRQLRAFLRLAKKWNLIGEVPEFRFLKEASKLPTYVDAETFAKLYAACDAASAPSDTGYTPNDWWQAYLVFLYMTGWRALEPLTIKRADLDEKAGRVLLRAEHQKGGRDTWVPLHPMVLDHLECVRHFGEMLFPWPNGRRRLWDEFHRIQAAAGVAKPDGSFYGFHDLRRGFATANADRMTGDALQVLMRHRDYGTTQRYINMVRQLNPAVANLATPTLPAKKGGAS